MFDFIKNLFRITNKSIKTEFSKQEYEIDYDLKSNGLESVLGKMHNLVGHAIIPFEVGGAVDMYYFPNHIKGTGFATMELIQPNGKGPLPNRLGTYELVAFTKHDYAESDAKTPFNLIERRICNFFTILGSFSRETVINPNDTCEIPNEEGENSSCLVFDVYEPGNKKFNIGEKRHHLILCIEVFKSEVDFARINGSTKLFEKLKQMGYYPYSDLDRQPVA